MTRLQITTPDALPEESSADAALRPSQLDEFVGQLQVRQSLGIAVEAAKKRGETLDHILFFGPPGLGKTTLAMLLAREMGVQLRTTSGPVLEKPGDLVGLLTSLTAGDMLFIVEIHLLRAACSKGRVARSSCSGRLPLETCCSSTRSADSGRPWKSFSTPPWRTSG